jgi:hypothetical protein
VKPTDSSDRLPVGVRRRVAAFSDKVERIRLEDLPLYAATPNSRADHRQALEGAARAAAESGRQKAVEAARSDAVEFLMRLYGDSQYRPTWIGLNWGQSPGTTDDRVRVMQSLGEAVAALVLWDVLTEEQRDELLGPWAALVE